MPANPQMDPADIYTAIAEDLEAFVAQSGGRFSKATDPFHVIELLAEAPGRFRVILHDDGDEPAGESKRSSVVQCRFKITVSHNRGLPAVLGNKIASATGNEPSLLARVAEVRERLRGLTLPDGATSRRLEYGGRVPVTYQGAALDAYEMTFTIYAALPLSTPTL